MQTSQFAWYPLSVRTVNASLGDAMPPPQRIIRELLKTMDWADSWQKKLFVYGSILLGAAGPFAAHNIEIWKQSPILMYVVPATVAGGLFGWALAHSFGPEIEMSDLQPEGMLPEAGVRLTNRGDFKIDPRLTLIAIKSVSGTKRDLMRKSRPILWEPPKPGSSPVLSMHGQSAFVRIVVKFRDVQGSPHIGIWVPKEGVEAGPPVSLGLLTLSAEIQPVTITIGADCGESPEGNRIRKTFRINPTAGGGCEIHRVFPWYISLLRFFVYGDATTVSL